MILYRLDRKQGIRVFEIEYSNTTANIKWKWGKLGGKQTTKHIESTHSSYFKLYETKVKELYKKGYKTFEEHKEKLKIGSIEELPDTVSCNYTTNWDIMPMLAKVYRQGRDEFPMIAQPKLDGVRCLGIGGDKVTFLSRGGEYYNMPHLIEEVRHLTDRYNCILDGELYLHGEPLSKISGLARRVMVNMFDPLLEYHVYDIISGNKTQTARLVILNAMKTEKLEYIKIVESKLIGSHEEATKIHDKYVLEGYEGLILRKLNALYELSFRSDSLLKLKAFKEHEFQLVRLELVDNDIDTLKGVFITEEGNEFKSTFKGDRTYRRNILNSNLIGNLYTIRFLNWSVNELPEKSNVIIN